MWFCKTAPSLTRPSRMEGKPIQITRTVAIDPSELPLPIYPYRHFLREQSDRTVQDE